MKLYRQIFVYASNTKFQRNPGGLGDDFRGRKDWQTHTKITSYYAIHFMHRGNERKKSTMHLRHPFSY